MLSLLNRFSKYSIVILGFLAITLSHAQGDRAENISILDVDANGKVDALTDGLLLLRSMFGLTDDVLTTGVISSDATVSDATAIDSYISSIKGSTYGELTSGGGSQGPQGEKGDKGDTGSQGVAGADGAVGAKGDTGASGAKGDTGSQGAAGADSTVAGVTGAAGATGADGSDGATGPQGATGTAGADGSDGATGSQGATGTAGATGAQGNQGNQGAAGVDGSNGATGSTGPAGATGAAGADGRGLAWVSASNNVNGYWYYRYNTTLMAVQISGSDLVYTSPYDPEDGSVLDNKRTYYTSSDCQGMAYVDNVFNSQYKLEHSGSTYLIKRTSLKGGFSFSTNSYYGMANGVFGCYNSQTTLDGSNYYETEQTSLLMSTYQQSHTLRWSN
jgi:hypothetical protein